MQARTQKHFLQKQNSWKSPDMATGPAARPVHVASLLPHVIANLKNSSSLRRSPKNARISTSLLLLPRCTAKTPPIPTNLKLLALTEIHPDSSGHFEHQRAPISSLPPEPQSHYSKPRPPPFYRPPYFHFKSYELPHTSLTKNAVCPPPNSPALFSTVYT